MLKIFFLATLQNVVFCQTSTRLSHRSAHVPTLLTSLPSPSPPHPSRLSQSPCLSSLSHTANSIGYLFYIWYCKFPCYSLHTSHPTPSFRARDFFKIFILGCAGLPCCPQSDFSRCGPWVSHCDGFSCWGALAPGEQASVVAAPRLQSTGLIVVDSLSCSVLSDSL